MTIFTNSNVTLPTNSRTTIYENSSITLTNGITVSTTTETKIPYLSSSSPIATVRETTITTIPATQTTAETNDIDVSTSTSPVSVASVNLIMSDGVTISFFDSVATGLKLIEFMNSRNQYYLQASDDIMIINVDGAKLFIINLLYIRN